MEYTAGYWVGTIPKEVLAYGSVRWYISASDADSDWLGDKAEGKTIVYTTEIIDDKPPQIYGYSIEPRIVYVGEPAVIWAIIEEPERASGISIVKLRILQGNKTLSEYNMSFDGLRYASSIIMREAGNYTAEITAKDNAGNEAKISFTFTVIGRSILKVQLPAYLITYIASGLIIVLIAGVSVYIIKSRGIKIKEPEQ